MTSSRILIALALALALTQAALAQSSDAAYCKALSDKYQTYVAKKEQSHRGGQAPLAGIDTAISRCQSDPAGSIPVLEKELQNNKLDLPPRA